MIEEVLAKKYPLETLGFWQPARMCSSWWMTEATNAARAPCHTTAHTSVFCLSWKSTVKRCHAYSCRGGAQGILTLGCQFSYCFCKFAPMVSRAFWGPIDRGSKKQKTHESFWPQLSRSAYQEDDITSSSTCIYTFSYFALCFCKIWIYNLGDQSLLTRAALLAEQRHQSFLHCSSPAFCMQERAFSDNLVQISFLHSF